MRLIDADALPRHGQRGGLVHWKDIAEAPTIDAVSVVHGEWLIEKTLYDNYNYRCSYCDWYETHAYPDAEPYNYCPNCGADMRGADDEHDK